MRKIITADCIVANCITQDFVEIEARLDEMYVLEYKLLY